MFSRNEQNRLKNGVCISASRLSRVILENLKEHYRDVQKILNLRYSNSFVFVFLFLVFSMCVTVENEVDSYFTFLYQRPNEPVPFLERPNHPHESVMKACFTSAPHIWMNLLGIPVSEDWAMHLSLYPGMLFQLLQLLYQRKWPA